MASGQRRGIRTGRKPINRFMLIRYEGAGPLNRMLRILQATLHVIIDVKCLVRFGERWIFLVCRIAHTPYQCRRVLISHGSGVGTIAGLLCIGLASLEKISNYLA